MAIRMRYGLEAEFNSSKMVVGEWAVSTDSRFVRMCFAPGVVLRMATYEAFEADMAKIKAILAESKDIQTAITRIQSEVNAKAVLCAEYAESAKESADAAAESAEQAKMYAENASAVTNVQIATKDIAGLIKGGDNHIAEDGTLVLTDRTDSGLLQPSHAGGIRLHSISAVEDRQDGTTGKNLLSLSEFSTNASGSTSKFIDLPRIDSDKYYILSGRTTDGIELTNDTCQILWRDKDNNILASSTALSWSDGANYGQLNGATTFEVYIAKVLAGKTVRVQLEEGTVATPWEPYTGGKPSPAPGEPVVTSANQLKLNGTSQTVNGATVNFDMANQFVVISGDPTADAEFIVGTAKLEAGTWYANAICMPNAATIFEYSVTDANGNTLLNVEANTEDVNVSETFTLTEAQTVTFKFMLPSGEAIDQEFIFAIVADANADWDEYTVEYTEGYPQKIEGTVMKNLLDCRGLTEQTIEGVTFTPVYDAEGNLLYINAKGISTARASYIVAKMELEAGDYVYSQGFTGNASGAICFLTLFHLEDSVTFVDTAGMTEKVFTLTEKTRIEAVVEIRVSGVTVSDHRFYPMIRPAEILDDTYVPYGCMRVKTHGAQLMVPELKREITSMGVTITPQDGNFIINGTKNDGTLWEVVGVAKLTVGEKYTLSANTQLRISVWDDIGYTTATLKAQNEESVTFEPTNTGNHYIVISNNSNTIFQNVVANIMLNVGTEALSYQPYKEYSTILSHPFSEFHNIGGEGDKVTPSDEVRRFATVVFDGSDDEGWYMEGESLRFRSGKVKALIKKVTDPNARGNLLCNRFQVKTGNQTYVKNEGISSEINGDLTVWVDGMSSVDEWRAYLSAYPMTVVYELATEQVTPLPTADQIALHSLKSYDGVTHLYTDTYPQMVIDAEWGTSKVGAVAFEGYNAGRRAEIRAEANYNELAAALLALNQE